VPSLIDDFLADFGDHQPLFPLVHQSLVMMFFLEYSPIRRVCKSLSAQ
jgi:hypothetical protein